MHDDKWCARYELEDEEKESFLQRLKRALNKIKNWLIHLGQRQNERNSANS